MRTNLEEILRGKSLRSEIYRTLTAKKFQTLSLLLRNARHPPHQRPYSSQHSIFPSQHDSPHYRTDLSVPRLTPSPPSRTHSRSRHRLSAEHMRHKSQRSKPKTSLFDGHSKSKKKQAYLRSLTLRGEEKRSKSKSKEKKKKSEKGGKQEQRKKDKRVGRSKSRSEDRASSNLNLSSIMEQSSSEQKLATPRSNRPKEKSRKRAAHSDDRTRKKDNPDYLPDSLRKRLQRSFKDPETFQRILKSDSINIKFRILRRRLLEIEIHTLKMVEELSVRLEKGNLECQNIQQHYQTLQPNSSISLFTSVRDVVIDEPFRMPKLLIEVTLAPQQIKVQRAITLPYSWLHFTEDSSKQPQKSRIKTKICLENVGISHRGLKYLRRVLPAWHCRSSRVETIYESRFAVGANSYQLQIYGGNCRWTVELSGRGEERLTRLIEYFSELLC